MNEILASPGTIQANVSLDKREIFMQFRNRPRLITSYLTNVRMKSGSPLAHDNIDRFRVQSTDQDGEISVAMLERRKANFGFIQNLNTIGNGQKLLKLEKSGQLRKYSIPFSLVVSNPKNIITNYGRVKVLRKLSYMVDGKVGYSDKKIDESFVRMDFGTGNSTLILALHLDVFKQDFANAQICATYLISYFFGTEEHNEGNYVPSSKELPRFEGFFEISITAECATISTSTHNNWLEPCETPRMRRSPTPSQRSLSFPPSYSQLSSRAPSIETLPPPYHELQKGHSLDYADIN